MTENTENCKTVRLKLVSECRDCSEAIISAPPGENTLEEKDIKVDRVEFVTEATLTKDGSRLFFDYNDREIFEGVDDARSTLIFDTGNRGLVTLLRSGSIRAALVFEQGKRHICVYRTPYAPFEICINTVSVRNRLTEKGGTLSLDYYTEVHGVRAEHTKLKFTVTAIDNPAVPGDKNRGQAAPAPNPRGLFTGR